MKLKNFAMITEDKVTEIFCVADDFCKVYDAQMAKYTFKAEGKRKYHRESRMSKAEIMIIMILFHSSGYRCLKHFYLEKVCKHMRHLFPEVVLRIRSSFSIKKSSFLLAFLILLVQYFTTIRSQQYYFSRFRCSLNLLSVAAVIPIFTYS